MTRSNIRFATDFCSCGFLGWGLGDRVPDAKTVWLYLEALVQAGKVEEVFALFDGYLARRGYIARGGQILDASIVPVPHNHNKREENAAIKAGETPVGWADKPAKRCQKDVDARWTKKHGRPHYGYKNHVNVDPRLPISHGILNSGSVDGVDAPF
jgi:IS5 family transposase